MLAKTRRTDFELKVLLRSDCFFSHYRDECLFYKITNEQYIPFIFKIPTKELQGSMVMNNENPMTFMKWIKIALENIVDETEDEVLL